MGGATAREWGHGPFKKRGADTEVPMAWLDGIEARWVKELDVLTSRKPMPERRHCRASA